MRSKWINRVLSVALLFTTLTTSVSYTFTTAYFVYGIYETSSDFDEYTV